MQNTVKQKCSGLFAFYNTRPENEVNLFYYTHEPAAPLLEHMYNFQDIELWTVFKIAQMTVNFNEDRLKSHVLKLIYHT